MRRWQLLTRFFHGSDPLAWDRCILVVEELETREVLSPTVDAPFGFFQINENQPLDSNAIVFSGSNENSFFVDDPSADGQIYVADLIATNGTIDVDELFANSINVSVANDETSTVTLTGDLNDINSVLSFGFTFEPTFFYSGDAAVRLTVTDTLNDVSDSDLTSVQVLPVASNAFIDLQAFGEVYAPSSGFVFAPGFITIFGWGDTDGSETLTLSIQVGTESGSVSVPDGVEFTLSSGGVIIPPVEPNFWQLSSADFGNNPVAFQAFLDSLVLTPQTPEPFSGRAFIFVFGDIFDQAEFLVGDPPQTAAVTEVSVTEVSESGPFALSVVQTPSQSIGSDFASLRFFVGGSVTTPPVFGQEGGTLDLGGRFVASDPDELPNDIHTLTLFVPNGTLTFDSNVAIFTEVSASREVAADGSTTITLVGTIEMLNEFLAMSGSLSYTAATPFFSDVVPLTITLTNQPGQSFPSEGSNDEVFSEEVVSVFDSESSNFFPETPIFITELPGTIFESSPSTASAPNPFSRVVSLSFAPIASQVFPSAVDVVTDQDTPVALGISVTPLADTDGSETLSILVTGVPAGATFNKGTDLGGGQWAFSAADLAGLTFTPPTGVSGVFTFVVTATVTDSAPTLGTTDTRSESTTFTVTVIPAPVVPPDPPVEPPVVPPVVPPADPPVDQPVPSIVVLPPDFTTRLSTFDFTSINVGGTAIEIDPAFDDETDAVRDRGQESTTFVNTLGSSSNDTVALGELARTNLSTPSPASLFGQAEAPQPIYAGGEKHPLPPVLPLDQTLPVAGFTESGGDSIALVDQFYRNAKRQPAISLAPQPRDVSIGIAQQNAPIAISAPVIAVASTSDTNDTTGASTTPTVAEESANERQWWIGATVMLGAMVAWGWLTRGPDWFLGRTFRRLLRVFQRTSAKRTA